MADLKIRFSRFAAARDVFLAELAGSIDASTVHIFQQELEKARRQGVNKLVLDVSKIKYVNSTGLGSLVKYADAFRAAGGGLVLLKVPPKVKIVIEMLGLHEFFEMVNTSREALSKLTGGVPAVSPSAPTVVKRPSPVAKRPPATAAPKKSPSRPPATPSDAQPVPKPKRPPAPPKSPVVKAPPKPTAVSTKPPQPSAPSAPPKPAAPPKPIPSLPSFPIVVTCGSCGVDLEVPRSGNFKCPRCQATINIDAAGNASYFAPNKPLSFQMVLASNKIATEALKSFVGVVAEHVGFGNQDTAALKSAVEEISNVIANRVYEGEENTYSVLITPETNSLTVVFSDHGESLPPDAVRSVFPQSSKSFEEFEVTPHPRGGNLIRIVKRK